VAYPLALALGPRGVREQGVLEWLGRLFGTAVGWGVFALGCLVWALVVVPPALLLSRVWPPAREYFNDFTRGALRFYVAILPFMGLRVEGRGRRAARPCVLVVNHQSRLDPIVMMALEPRLSGPVRRYLYRTPALGAVLRLAGFYEAEVGEPAPLARLHASAGEARGRAGALLFFPEGTRSEDGRIGPFRRGAFRLAVDAGLPIQPVVLEGMEVLPPTTWVVRKPWRYPVTVSYLPPREPPFGEGPVRNVARSLAESVRASMIEEIERLRAQRAAARR
jgi:1-acyl-sn-glycerol-3-phosphate acyltransferase